MHRRERAALEALDRFPDVYCGLLAVHGVQSRNSVHGMKAGVELFVRKPQGQPLEEEVTLPWYISLFLALHQVWRPIVQRTRAYSQPTPTGARREATIDY